MDKEQRILDYLGKNPDSSPLEMVEGLQMRVYDLYAHLYALEHVSEAIESKWIGGPYPRRRVYRLKGTK